MEWNSDDETEYLEFGDASVAAVEAAKNVGRGPRRARLCRKPRLRDASSGAARVVGGARSSGRNIYGNCLRFGWPSHRARVCEDYSPCRGSYTVSERFVRLFGIGRSRQSFCAAHDCGATPSVGGLATVQALADTDKRNFGRNGGRWSSISQVQLPVTLGDSTEIGRVSLV